MRVIAEGAWGALDEIARLAGRAKPNLSRRLKIMEGYGLLQLERGARGRITAKIVHDRVELDLPLTRRKRAARKSEISLDRNRPSRTCILGCQVRRRLGRRRAPSIHGLAEREGFEPPIRLPVCRISSAVHSTTLPPLQLFDIDDPFV